MGEVLNDVLSFSAADNENYYAVLGCDELSTVWHAEDYAHCL